MATIGLYGVYYSKATLTSGVVSAYDGVKQMGKAISATFTPEESGDNPLYANNGIAENDNAAASGGEIKLGLDKLSTTAIVDLFGLTQSTKTVTVGSSTVTGTGFDYSGSEASNTVGVAFIRQKQEDGSRAIHEAVIFKAVTFKFPEEETETLGESVEWQTPEIEGTVYGAGVANPWMEKYTFPTQEAAIAYITSVFAAST